MMSQNRQDTKDRLRGELDYDVNRRAESEIQGLARKLNLLGEKIGDVEDLLRQKVVADGSHVGTDAAPSGWTSGGAKLRGLLPATTSLSPLRLARPRPCAPGCYSQRRSAARAEPQRDWLRRSYTALRSSRSNRQTPPAACPTPDASPSAAPFRPAPWLESRPLPFHPPGRTDCLR